MLGGKANRRAQFILATTSTIHGTPVTPTGLHLDRGRTAFSARLLALRIRKGTLPPSSPHKKYMPKEAWSDRLSLERRTFRPEFHVGPIKFGCPTKRRSSCKKDLGGQRLWAQHH